MADKLLLETGDALLLEDGTSFLLLETDGGIYAGVGHAAGTSTAAAGGGYVPTEVLSALPTEVILQQDSQELLSALPAEVILQQDPSILFSALPVEVLLLEIHPAVLGKCNVVLQPGIQ